MRNLLRALVEGIRLAFWTAVTGAQIAAPYAHAYLVVLAILAAIAIFLPLPFAIAGIVGGWGWLTALAGILWSLASIVLFAFAAPLAVLLDTLIGALRVRTGGAAGAGNRYVRFVEWALLTELFATLFASVVPLNENYGAIPVVIIAAAFLGVASAYWGTSGILGRWTMVTAASIVLVLFTMSFFVPTIASAIGERAVSTERRYGEAIRRGEFLKTVAAIGADYPLCGGTNTTVISTVPSTTQVLLRADCWSGWISMPNTPYRSRITLNPPGPLEMKLLGDERFLFGTDPESIGGIGYADFRLRGAGTATIAVEAQ